MIKTGFAIAAIAMATAPSAAVLQELVFFANISGENEVPGNDSPALGFLSGVYDTGTNNFEFSWLITPNLQGTPSAPGAHIHRAPAGSNGPIVFGFASGEWDLFGSATWEDLSSENLADLVAGNLYVNFHTSAFPGGEVRGQILLVPTPGTLGLAGVGLLAMARRRR